jgi:hypothetical protein
MESSMDHQSAFSESVRRHFAYLTDDLGFVLVEDRYHKSSSSCIVAFQSKRRYISLIWGLKDTCFYFAVYRVLEDGKPAPYADYSSDLFYIFALALFHERQLDMKYLTSMDPYRSDPQILDGKVRRNAELLWKHGKEILEGRSWFDCQSNEVLFDSPSS